MSKLQLKHNYVKKKSLIKMKWAKKNWLYQIYRDRLSKYPIGQHELNYIIRLINTLHDKKNGVVNKQQE